MPTRPSCWYFYRWYSGNWLNGFAVSLNNFDYHHRSSDFCYDCPCYEGASAMASISPRCHSWKLVKKPLLIIRVGSRNCDEAYRKFEKILITMSNFFNGRRLCFILSKNWSANRSGLSKCCRTMITTEFELFGREREEVICLRHVWSVSLCPTQPQW